MLCDFQLGKFCVLPINHPGKHVMEDDDTPDFRTALAEIAGGLERLIACTRADGETGERPHPKYFIADGSGREFTAAIHAAKHLLTTHAAAIKGAKG